MFDHSPIKDGFPRYAGELLRQASFYTRFPFRLVHEEEAAALQEINENICYLSYQDIKPRWDRFLYAATPEQNKIVYGLTRELAAQLFLYIKRNDHEQALFKTRFILTQMTLMLGSMMCATLNLARHPENNAIIYPIKQLPRDKNDPYLSAANVWLTAPTPFTSFLLTPEGATYARQEYLTYDGTLRLDLMTTDTLCNKSHIHAHYKNMMLFGLSAGELAKNDAFFSATLAALRKKAPQAAKSVDDSTPETRANTLLLQWWTGVEKDRKKRGLSALPNHYVGQRLWGYVAKDVLNHPAQIRRAIYGQAKTDPSDPLARFMKSRMEAQSKGTLKPLIVIANIACSYGKYPDEFRVNFPPKILAKYLQSVQAKIQNRRAVRNPARGNHVNASGSDGLNT